MRPLTSRTTTPDELRVLVLAPTERDASLTASILGRAGMTCVTCATIDAACRELDAGAGALILAEEAIAADPYGCLSTWLGQQPAWSDLPILILAHSGADSAIVIRATEVLRNVSVFERPVRLATLTSAVRTALRARVRQYEIRDQLEQREMEAQKKDEFLAILAHELRNPLAPIWNSLHLLRLTGQRDATIARVGEMMERQVGHLVRLVDDLLEVSRITSGKLDLRLEVLDVHAIVRGAVETSRPLIDAARHTLEVALPNETLVVEGDSVRLTQVVANLLNNAAKYTEPGGRIWVTAGRDGHDVAIAVRDTGAGIDAEMLPRAFELFTQVDRRPGRAHDGLGIGLSLVKSLVEMHHGRVTAHSDGLGHGSEFIVSLPLASTARVEAIRPSASTGVKTLPARRVLIVDDNRDAAQSLGLLLSTLGVDVHVTFGGREALEAIPIYKPSIVLLDVGMPLMDGYEVAREIRKRPDGDSIALIALTGWGQDEDRRRSRAAGFDYHLVKPADLSALEALFSSLEPHGRATAGSAGPPSVPRPVVQKGAEPP